MATAESDFVPVDQFENLLTCSICLETLNDPRTLPCFHSFCKCCLEKFVKSHREKAVTKNIEQFNCPTCLSEFTLKPLDEVAGMASSHFIRNMLDIMAIQRRARTSKCSVCQEPAIKRCTTCEMFMCEKCLVYHDIWPPNKKHTVLSLSELTQHENQTKIKAKLYCKKHKNKTLKFYCETCKELICTHCMVLNHIKQNHSCLSIDEVADKQREALRLGCATLNNKLAEGNEALVAICNAIHLLEDNTKKIKAKIIQQKQEILQTVNEKLEEKAQSMIDEVDKLFSTKHDDLSKQLAGIKAYVEKVKSSVILPKSLLEKGNNEEILSSQTMIDENIEKVKNELPKNLEPVHDGSIQYENEPINDLNVTEILDNLGEIGKMLGWEKNKLTAPQGVLINI